MGKPVTYSPRLETEYMAAMIQNPSQRIDVSVDVGKSDIGYIPYQLLYNAWDEMEYNDIEITPQTTINYLERTGQLGGIRIESMPELCGADAVRFLYELPFDNYGEEPPPLQTLARQVADVSALRKLQYLSTNIQSKVEDGQNPAEIAAFVDLEIGKIGIQSGKNVGAIYEAKEAVSTFLDRYEKIVKGEIEPFIETGLRAIDNAIGGLGKGKVILVSGTSGDGKTVFVQNILSKIGIENTRTHRVAFIKMEGGKDEAMARHIQILSGIDKNKPPIDSLDIERGRVPDSSMPHFKELANKISKSKLIINASPGGMTMRQLKNQLIKLASMGVEVVVVDQLNNLELETDKSSYLDSDKKGYLLKKWSEELDIHIIAVHQLNKSTNSVHRKGAFDLSLSDLAESGEKAMDAVFFVRHDESKTLVMCVKARVGKKINVPVKFDFMSTRYDNLSIEDEINLHPDMDNMDKEF